MESFVPETKLVTRFVIDFKISDSRPGEDSRALNMGVLECIYVCENARNGGFQATEKDRFSADISGPRT